MNSGENFFGLMYMVREKGQNFKFKTVSHRVGDILYDILSHLAI